MSKKIFGRSVGQGASLSGVGGVAAERNRVYEEVSELEEKFTVLLFAYLPKWKSART